MGNTMTEVRKLLDQGKSKDEVAEILMKKGGYDADDVGATLERELKKRTKKIAVALVVTSQAKEKTVKQLVFASTEEAMQHLANLTGNRIHVATVEDVKKSMGDAAIKKLKGEVKATLVDRAVLKVQEVLKRRPQDIELYVKNPPRVLSLLKNEVDDLSNLLHSVVEETVADLDPQEIMEQIERWNFDRDTGTSKAAESHLPEYAVL